MVEALPKVCIAVQLFAFAMLSEREDAVPPTCAPRVPEDVIDAPTASEEVATDESALVPLP